MFGKVLSKTRKKDNILTMPKPAMRFILAACHFCDVTAFVTVPPF